MKVALIGSGFIARVHVEALQAMKQDVILVVDHQLDHAKEFAKEYNILNYSDQFEDCLKKDIDCVHICTPPTTHYEFAKKAIQNKKHVICEKPLCLNSDEAKELAILAEKNNVVAVVNFNVRYNDALLKMHDAIAEEKLGDVLMVHGSYQQQFHLLPTAYSWRYDEKIAGTLRATSEIGSHWFDLARYLTGLEVTEVSATFGKFFVDRFEKDGMMYEKQVEGSEPIKVHSDDAASITLRFSNGALGNLFLSEISHGKNNEICIEINGKNQSSWWNSEHPYQFYLANNRETSCSTNAFAGGFQESFQTFFKDVYQWILTGEKTSRVPTFWDGYQNALICNAVYESATNHSQWIEVKK